jgi:hypothetical protein
LKPIWPGELVFVLTFVCFVLSIDLLFVFSRVAKIRMLRRLRKRGARGFGVALSNRSNSPRRGWSSDYYTTISYVVDGKRRVREISGNFHVGRNVSIVYDPEMPNAMVAECDLRDGALIAFVEIAIMIVGSLIFLITLIKSEFVRL